MKKALRFLKFYLIHILTGILSCVVYYLCVRFFAYYVSKLFDLYSFTVINTLVVLIDTIVCAFVIDKLCLKDTKLFYLKALINWWLGLAVAVLFFWVSFVVQSMI